MVSATKELDDDQRRKREAQEKEQAERKLRERQKVEGEKSRSTLEELRDAAAELGERRYDNLASGAAAGMAGTAALKNMNAAGSVLEEYRGKAAPVLDNAYVKAFAKHVPYVGQAISYSGVIENGMRAASAIANGDKERGLNELKQLAIRGTGAGLNHAFGKGFLRGAVFGGIQVATEKWADNVRQEQKGSADALTPAKGEVAKALDAPKPGTGAGPEDVQGIKKRLMTSHAPTESHDDRDGRAEKHEQTFKPR